MPRQNHQERTIHSGKPFAHSELISELHFHVKKAQVLIRTYALHSPMPVNENIGRAQATHIAEAFIFEGNGSSYVRGASLCSAKDDFDLKKGEVLALTRAIDILRPHGISKDTRTNIWESYHMARNVDDELLFLKALIHAGTITPATMLRELAIYRVNA